jgi:16S rRNA processing protein RimM
VRRPPRASLKSELAIGRIAGTFGVRGELKLDVGSAGRAVVSAGAELRCAQHEASSTVRIASVRPHKGRLLVRFAGIDDAAAAEAYVGGTLLAPREAIALDDGEYLDDDLVGCTVHRIDGSVIGEVDRIEHYPSSDMLVIAGRMIPMVRAIVTEIDLNRRRIVIDPPEGLLD